jgi:hypothetical protein
MALPFLCMFISEIVNLWGWLRVKTWVNYSIDVSINIFVSSPIRVYPSKCDSN